MSTRSHLDQRQTLNTFRRGCMKSTAELGTVVGPNAFGELLVARPCTHEDNDGRRDFWAITPSDLAQVRRPDHSPRSLTEIKLRAAFLTAQVS